MYFDTTAIARLTTAVRGHQPHCCEKDQARSLVCDVPDFGSLLYLSILARYGNILSSTPRRLPVHHFRLGIDHMVGPGDCDSMQNTPPSCSKTSEEVLRDWP